ncbi:MAG: aminopeptidase P family protein [Bacilli bacterium]|nr:aminopeptidase P family protein [Bacilli bacterium]
MEIKDIQKEVARLGGDAWIIVDYENKNPALVKMLGERMLTRKIFLVLPSEGKPYLITHSIDTVYLSDPSVIERFDLRVYKTWEEMLALERESFSSYKKVFMDVSENGLLPRVSLADYGSVSFIESLGIEILSSADLLQFQTAVMNEKSLQSQIKACKTALKIKDEAFKEIARRIRESGVTSELEIQQFIARRFDEEGMVYDEAPLVAIGKNASNPHYTPTEESYSPIKEGDLVLIDMWAKYKEPGSVYADITWMGYVGTKVPEEYQKRFAIIRNARDAAIELLKRELPLRNVHAYEADDAARKVIEEAGFGEWFLHRLGHSIYDDDSPHGPGANLDNYESHDTRLLLDGTSFSDEPGIYTPEYGMRTETDLHIQGKELLVVGGLQTEVLPILALY